METGTTTKLRNTGIGPVGYRPWGTHFCNFYATKTDLVEMLVPYFKAGLENKEFCVWVISEPLTEPEAWSALRETIPELDEYRTDGCIEILHGREWYLKHGMFDMERVTRAWNDKMHRALDRGYAGLRVSGNTTWLERKDWSSFCHYEKMLSDNVVDQNMTVLCTYPMATSGAADLLDVISTHQFAGTMRNGSWELIETPELKQAKAEIKRMNDELELRVVQRTIELETANQKLREAQVELAHINPVMTMGEWTASIAHEVKHPLAAIVDKANAGIRFLRTQSPDLKQVQQSLVDIVEQGTMAGDVISRLRAQVKKAELAKAEADVNQSIPEGDRPSQDVQPWKRLYRAAVLETIMELVPRRIAEARKAAGERAVHLIREASDGEPELQDLLYASVVLNELNKKFQSAGNTEPRRSTSENQSEGENEAL
jgi:signal transduction histidine kinase